MSEYTKDGFLEIRDSSDYSDRCFFRRTATILGGTAVILWNLFLPSISVADSGPNTLPNCYSEESLNEIVDEAYERFDTSDGFGAINVELNQKRTALDIVPDEPLENIERVESATVKVLSTIGGGTGFVIENNGKKLVVTAAHVAMDNMANISIKTKDSKQFSVSGGCLMHADIGDDNQVHQINNDYMGRQRKDTVDIDMAILEVEDSENLPQALPISVGARRGDVLTTNNYQIDDNGERTDVENSQQYDLLSGYVFPMTTLAVDGLKNILPLNKNGFVRDRNMSGSSGGPVLNSYGEVVGVIYGSSYEDTYFNSQQMKETYNINISDHDANIIQPGNVFFGNSQILTKALESDILKN